MRKRMGVFSVGFLLLALGLSGCMTAPVVPPWGSFYTQIKAPLDLDSQNGKQIGPKRGVASTTAWLGLVSTGDAGVRAAAENGDITRINHLDYEFQNIFFGLYARYTTIAYGE